MSGVNEIRSAFLDYFAKADHAVVPSSSLVPRNDPTLMFTNAGMVQFKNVFTGVEKRPYNRATTAQKCVRAGGKHNDLDNVGYTARHHTFFEMLGNFSFGDYFKPQAIELAWSLITKEFGLSKDRLLVTVYADDEDAAGLWRKIAGFSDDRIIRIGTSDNFWQMGDTGPCGPCSEIFIDQGPGLQGGPPGSPDEDGDRFLEFWNLVFMQYEQIEPGNRLALPRPSIDTGMGLERMAAILQGVTSNYDTDLFKALIDSVSHAVGRPPETGNVASYRVIADHLRSVSFLIADGVLPSNEGRGYVLRRIMRRAMRHLELLGSREPVMFRLVPTLVREMGQAYPELTRAESLISETLRLEETRFRRTLERGLAILDSESRSLVQGQNLSGETAFTLYDTYGFPLDLTQDALKARGIGVDTEAFGQAMERQRQAARAAWTGSGESATETVWYGIKERVGASEFLGYETESAEGIITAILREGREVDGLSAGETGLVLVNQTPFYAESGGQVGDTGLLSATGLKARVTATEKKLGDLFVHHVTVDEGRLTMGQPVELAVDHARRSAIRANHSATHLLHEALRQVLGDHVAQKGSLVSPERLRFDFSHPKPLDEAELRAVEDIANAVLLQNTPVVTKLMAQDEAVASGARALFGEKYGDEVRVVSMGRPVDNQGELAEEGRLPAFSIELCGGTHAARTGEIGQITVLGESAVGAGVRRIEALTAGTARRHRAEESRTLSQIAGLLKSQSADVPERLSALIEDRRRLERELSEAKKKLAMGGTSGGDDGVTEIAGIKVMAKVVEGVETRDLKSLVDAGKSRIGSGIVALVGLSADGKAGLVVGVTADLTDRYDAVALVRAGAGHLGGKGGGGRRDMAQAGGPEGSGAQAAIDAIREALSVS
ncbi:MULTISPECIES: alanine--tRNA ligase [unclassified Methylobacterium]|uniref:alanine--tRNA ligase n=1 Tax=unclassified Methylobacterium TaxID=2615210 RepID=UPI0006FBEDB4|nr:MULTISPECIES: alanine--tRNA ligase [unclassified Methylobacterium]KQO59847.1 alanine--tRNA ligase [Methylobacterium sp. Leaf86]KQO85800.1 alanine--tRNA ligase [Methylobacterium sp. Leaf91]